MPLGCYIMPKTKKEQKRAEGLAHHREMQKAKDDKKKQRKNLSLPAKHAKGKK